MEYPEYHRQIVDELIRGRFILSRERQYEDLQKQESDYTEYFEKSFGYELTITQEYAFLVSQETNEHLSRDISIFFAILCYELDREGKNFLDLLEYSEFSIDEIDQLFENSSYIDLIRGNNQLKDSNERHNLLNRMNRLNIIEDIKNDNFHFTPAYKVFMAFAQELAQTKVEISVNGVVKPTD